MNAIPATLRRIRSALRLAADPRAPKGEAKSAARMAAKLMRKHCITDADLWADPHEAKPGTAKLRVSVVLNSEDDSDRVMFALRMALTRFPDVRGFLWISRISARHAYIEFVGPRVEMASEFWKRINRELWEAWAVMQKLKGFSLLTPGNPMPHDHFSWLAGVTEGFEAQEALDRKTEERAPLPALPAPKKKRRTLPRKNKFALAVIPPKIIQVEPKGYNAAIEFKQHMIRSIITSVMGVPKLPPEPPPETRMIHVHSYQSGMVFGSTLSRQIPRK